MSYPIHPAVELTPVLTAEEYAEMVESIRERGQSNPITVCRGFIVDGRHRLRACQELGIEPRYIIRDDIPDVWMFVWDQCGIGRQFASQEQKYLVWKKLHSKSDEELQAKLAAVKAEERRAKAAAATEQHKVSKPYAGEKMENVRLVQGPSSTQPAKPEAKSRAIKAEAAKVNKGAVAKAEALEKKAPELAEKVASGEMKFAEAAKKANVHVGNNSGENEWYTPPEYIEAARRAMGSIDTDPASNPKAQETVQAATYYTAETNGLDKDWHGNVWMNPPYSAALIKQFAWKLVEQVARGNVKQACVLVNNATEAQWFQELVSAASVVAFTRKRVRFLDPQGSPGAPLQGQAVIYIGQKPELFIGEFSELCWCARVE
jgi:phage N-6-adenine-methyltransferase